MIQYNSGTVRNCYSTAAVSGANAVAGLLGTNNGNVNDSYSTGSVSYSSYGGGLIGNVDIFTYGTTTASFWDTETSNQGTSYGGTGRTTAQMKEQLTFTNAGWDFASVWSMDGVNNDGYPYLKWQAYEAAISTEQVTNIDNTSVTAHGSIENFGNPQIVNFGFQVSTDIGFSSPTEFMVQEVLELGAVARSISGLQPETDYFIRAVASNASQTYYGNITLFTTLGDTEPAVILSPGNGSYRNAFVDISIDFPENALPGSAELLFTNTFDGSTTQMQLNVQDAGQYDFTLNLDDIGSSTHVISATANSVPEGTYELSVVYRDAAGNPEAVSETISGVVIDKTDPTPTLLNVPSVTSEPFAVRLVFSEPIMNLTDQPVIVSPDALGNPRAELGTLQTITEGLEYEIWVTPLVQGTLSLFFDMYGMATDLAGNYTEPLLEYPVLYDSQGPQLLSVRLSSNHPGNPQVATVGDEIYLDFETDEPVEDYIVNFSSAVTLAVDLGDNQWRATRTVDEFYLEGDVFFELFVADALGNAVYTEATTNGSQVVVDRTPPTAVCQTYTAQLNEQGQAVIAPENINDGSLDNFGIASLDLDISDFSCDDIGENQVALTVVDQVGLTASCTAIVVVEDNLPPIVATMDVTVELASSGTAQITPNMVNNGSWDNCGIATMQLDVDRFTGQDLGANTVQLTVTDIHGNQASANATVYVTALDDDNDGVYNHLDDCPNTPVGTFVDVHGCETVVLPRDNYTVTVLSGSCSGNANGQIQISVVDTSYDYELDINGTTVVLNEQNGFSYVADTLSAGSYSICITPIGQPHAECFETVIAPLPVFEVEAQRSDADQLILALTGSDLYFITINGAMEQTTESTYVLTLEAGENEVSVSTQHPCQGVFSENVVVVPEILAYPNPVEDLLHVAVPGNGASVKIDITDSKGVSVYSNTSNVFQNRVVDIDLSHCANGMLFLFVEVDGTVHDRRILKK